jgi:hypothetical protein
MNDARRTPHPGSGSGGHPRIAASQCWQTGLERGTRVFPSVRPRPLLDEVQQQTRNQAFANGGGITAHVVPDDDPYRTLDDLMVVVEALCPVWPERDIFLDSGKMRL